jgi:hypothetical protein
MRAKTFYDEKCLERWMKQAMKHCDRANVKDVIQPTADISHQYGY